MIIRSAFLIACTLPLISMSSVQVMAQRCPTIPGVHGPVSCCTNSEYVKLCRAMGIRWSNGRPAAQPQNPIPNDPSAKNAQKAVKDEAEAEKKLAEAEEDEGRTRKMLESAKGAKQSAEKALSDANEKVDALQKKVDATSDPAKKLELLKEQLAVKKSMLPVVRGRDQMGRSISNYESKLRTAEQTTARARAGLAQARQARIAAVTKRSPSSSFRSQASTPAVGNTVHSDSRPTASGPATTITPQYSLTGQQEPGLQTKMPEQPRSTPTTKFTPGIGGIPKPDWETATPAQREEYRKKANQFLQKLHEQDEKRYQEKMNRITALESTTRAVRDVTVGCLAGGPAGCAVGATTGAVVGFGTHVAGDVARNVGGQGAGHAVDFGAIGIHAARGDLVGAFDGIVMKGMDIFYNGLDY